jgi:hypothetical protein
MVEVIIFIHFLRACYHPLPACYHPLPACYHPLPTSPNRGRRITTPPLMGRGRGGVENAEGQGRGNTPTQPPPIGGGEKQPLP